MVKRILSFFLLPILFYLISVPALAEDRKTVWLTDPDAVCGSDYTPSFQLAAKLDAIFAGDAGIYYDKFCTELVDTTLGLSAVRNNGIRKYVGSAGEKAVETGTSCWIYANGVYYTLFGETTGSGEAGENSEMLNLRQTATRSMCYENFLAWGVRQGLGALIRASGHSMILLAYDEDTITVLDGNGNGSGLVAIRVIPWEKASGYISYIIQPKEDFYTDLARSGKCGENAGWVVDEEGTLTIFGTGEITCPGWKSFQDSIRTLVVENGNLHIGSSLFCQRSRLEQIIFEGTAPTFAPNAFLGVTARVQYPATQFGWTADMLQNYGGRLTWEPYGMTELKITCQPETVSVPSGANAEVSIAAEGDGLTYTWYTKNSGDTVYIKSSVTGSVYGVTMCDAVKDRQVLCVVKDQYGNSVISQRALLRMDVAAAASGSTADSP